MYLNKSNQGGFTLIELLVVVAIIGLLSSVVLSSLNTARAKARDAKTKSDIYQIKLALQLARDASSNGSFPGNAGWQCLKASGNCWRGGYSGNTTITNAITPFLPSIPKPSAPSASNYIYDAYLYYPYYPGPIGSSPAGTYIIYALEADSSASSCQGYFAGAYEAGYYYCYHLIEPS